MLEKPSGATSPDDRVLLSYVLPIRRESKADGAEELEELTAYLVRLSGWVGEVVVVDGSPPDVAVTHRRTWGDHVRLVAPDRDLADPPDKVSGVVTGSRLARHDVVVVGDDDVRWRRDQLADALARMAGADLVRPQNRFVPAPWHARWDTARMLINRATGGDWPGTMVGSARISRAGARQAGGGCRACRPRTDAAPQR